jgi:hypothetical protein
MNTLHIILNFYILNNFVLQIESNGKPKNLIALAYNFEN